MAFKTLTVYLHSTENLPAASVQVTKIDMPTDAIWGGMKFREKQEVTIEPDHPVHGVLLLKEKSEVVMFVSLEFKGIAHEAKLCINAQVVSSYAEISPGLVEISTSKQFDHCVRFYFQRKSVVNLPVAASKKAKGLDNKATSQQRGKRG